MFRGTAHPTIDSHQRQSHLMAPPKASKNDRTEWRCECREGLAGHICGKSTLVLWALLRAILGTNLSLSLDSTEVHFDS